MLNSNTFYVCTYLSEITGVFCGLFAAVYFTHKAIKDFDFTGVRFLIQFVNKNTVNKLMDVFIGQFIYRRISAYKRDKLLHVRAALGGGGDFLSQFRYALRQSLFLVLVAGSQKYKSFVRQLPKRVSRGFVPHGKLPLFITPLLWFCYAVEARF